MQKFKLGKIKLLPAKELVAAVLRKAILSRQLAEGQEITLEGIASMVGVSSMPVREAFQILAADGLIKVRPNKGAVVLGINEQTIREHYEIRALLESEAVAKASRPGTDISRIAEIHYAAEKALAANNSAEYSDLNQAFHMEIWNTAGNEKMKMLLSNMWNGLSMGQNVTEEEYATLSIQEHQGILQALEQHNEELARCRMRDHIIRSMENMLTRYIDDPAV
ncbi:GntR family transcriptional regulator [Mixta intestinalis]|uniref:HTH-type transcriptional repressor RspR n=1 Tax=Mixta intestinalis TaxID=1615494 RepID=A0A6P1Q5C3_9GAMM|nr:GntR family transcriptional regulator [Mixta intestinalis]QHM73641.1 HTH-type transcriptional repressor RspR [Mixta intestinalis]